MAANVPTIYQMNQVISTTSNSWMGNPSPTGAVANEFGNALFFGFHLSDHGATFTLAQVGYNFDPIGSPCKPSTQGNPSAAAGKLDCY